MSDSTEFVPAEVFHLTEFLADEMEARYWTRSMLAMLLLVERNQDSMSKIMLELALWFEVGPERKDILFTEKFAEELGHIFGVDPQTFRNLHASWMKHGRIAEGEPPPPAKE